MNLEPLQIEEIEQYLQGNLKGEALTAFENRLKTEPEFAKEVKIFEQLFEGIEQKGALDFEDKLLEWDKREAGQKAPKTLIETKGRVVSMRRYAAIAAALLLLLLPLGWILLKGSVKASNQELYANNYERYSDQHRGINVADENDPKAVLKEGIDLYFQKDYAASTEALNTFLRDASDDLSYEQTEAQFYLAMSAQETENSSKALLLLNEVLNSRHDYYKADALWYLSLINLQADNASLAKKYLERLIDKFPDYKRKAKVKKLLTNLNRNLD